MSWRGGWFGKDGKSGRVIDRTEYDVGASLPQTSTLPYLPIHASG